MVVAVVVLPAGEQELGWMSWLRMLVAVVVACSAAVRLQQFAGRRSSAAGQVPLPAGLFAPGQHSVLAVRPI